MKNGRIFFSVLLALNLSFSPFLLSTEYVCTQTARKIIPEELWLDEKRPVDRSERQTVSEKLPGNVFCSETSIPFAHLPKQVQQVVRFTTEDRYVDHLFHRDTILSPDPACPHESVKCYMYSPIVFDEELRRECLSLDSWHFMIQDGVFRLVCFELQGNIFRDARAEF